MSLIVVCPYPDAQGADTRLNGILRRALKGRETRTLCRVGDLIDLAGERLLFALPLGDTGTNIEYVKLLARLRREPGLLEGCTAGLIVDGASPFYTKSATAELALATNLVGCTFSGRPLVEGTGSLVNFRVQAKQLNTDFLGAYRTTARELADRLERETFPRPEEPELLVLHAFSHHTSNTLVLWGEVRSRLGDAFTATEIGLCNGALSDCSGCPYTMRLHLGERGGCFYGGVVQDEVYPAVRRCAGVVMLYPNYNDALSANLTAFINRLTVLFRQTRFHDRALSSIVVSGCSGGDTVARQLIAGLNMNKSFFLPGRFSMLETTNDPGEALTLPGIGKRLDEFAARTHSTLLD